MTRRRVNSRKGVVRSDRSRVDTNERRGGSVRPEADATVAGSPTG
jgi:hypothetical protein